MTVRNLILTGGINHDFIDTAKALDEVLAVAGIQSEVFSDIDEGFDALDQKTYDLVTVFALRWRMLDNDKYIPFRDEWAYEIAERDKNNLVHHLRQGRGLLGLHTAAICFDTWPQWKDLLGVSWKWDTTFHPPPETFKVSTTSNSHPSTNGLDTFDVTDEIYHNLAPSAASRPLLKTDGGQDHSTQTLAWANEASGGRVIYNAMAHDRDSVCANGHAQFLQQAALWCAGEKP